MRLRHIMETKYQFDNLYYWDYHQKNKLNLSGSYSISKMIDLFEEAWILNFRCSECGGGIIVNLKRLISHWIQITQNIQNVASPAKY